MWQHSRKRRTQFRWGGNILASAH